MQNKSEALIEARRWIRVGAVLMVCAVIIGALGSHTLRGLIAERGAVFATALQFHLAHGIAVLATAVAGGCGIITRSRLRVAAALLTVGIVLFSGSLYLLAITGTKVFGPITPVGGVALIAAWIALVLGGRRVTREPSSDTPRS